MPSLNRDYLEYLCELGWKERDIPARAKKLADAHELPAKKILNVYKRRLDREFKEFDRRGAGVIDYFLIVRELVAKAKSLGIMVGPGRGSAAGSIALYLLGITDVDPVRHNLMFERFLAPGRIDLPDIDLDFEDRRRGELYDYLKERYGAERVARVGTVSKMTARALVRDLGRVMLINMRDTDNVSKAMDPTMTIEKNAEMIDIVESFLEQYPDVKSYAEVIEGQVKNAGVHAAGVVVSPVDISEVVPIEFRKGENVTAFDMWGVQDRGLLKLDLLGLKTLSVIKDALYAVKLTEGVDIDLSTLDLDDEKTLQAFTDGDFVGVFQFDSHSAAMLCKGVDFVDFETIVAMTALDRPGTARSGLAQTYLERNSDPDRIESVHPIYDSITSETLGVPVYQEHVIRLCRQLGGFTAEEADKIRKLIGKSKGADALREYEEKFVSGSIDNGLNEEKAHELWDQLCEFGGYSFNKAHAASYSVIAYWTQYLKTHYPAAFFWGLVRNEKDDEKIINFAKQGEARGVKFIAPDVQRAGDDYRIDGNEILPSLNDIKYVKVKAVEQIEKGQPFDSFTDFIERCPGADKRVVEMLVKAGAMTALVPNTKVFLEYLPKLWKLKKKKGGLEKIAKFVKASAKHSDFSDEEARDLAASVNPFIVRTHPLEKHAEVIEKIVKVRTIEPEKVEHEKDGFFIGELVDYDVRESFNKQGQETSYAIVSIDGGGIKPVKFKIDHDIFETFPPAAFVNDLVIVHYHRSYKIPALQFVVSVLELEQNIKDGVRLNYYEKIVLKKLPRGTRILTNVRTHIDKNDNEMAFVMVMSAARAVEGVVFASEWVESKSEVAIGKPVKVKMKIESRDGKRSVIFQRMRMGSLV